MLLRTHTATLGAVLLFAACESPGGGGNSDGFYPTLTPDTSDQLADTSAAADSTAGADTSAPDTAPGPSTVCARWNADRAYTAEGAWTGSASACEAGQWHAPGPDNTLRQVNLYRWMAGLPAVELSAAKSVSAQACALIMHANQDLEHDVPAGWDCQSQAGRQAAKLSNLATTAGVQAVDLYMIDGGVPNLGHRRWVLSNTLGPIGAGSTSQYSCLHVINGQGDARARWTAWPPPGDFPRAAVKPFSWDSLDSAGWSIQSDSLNLRGAAVTITSDGQALPVTVSQVDPGYGSAFGVRIVPQGWTSQVGETYHVAVRGLVEDLDYDVRMVDCAAR